MYVTLMHAINYAHLILARFLQVNNIRMLKHHWCEGSLLWIKQASAVKACKASYSCLSTEFRQKVCASPFQAQSSPLLSS